MTKEILYAIMKLPHKNRMIGFHKRLQITSVKMRASFFASFCEAEEFLCGSNGGLHFSVCVTSIAHTFLLPERPASFFADAPVFPCKITENREISVDKKDNVCYYVDTTQK